MSAAPGIELELLTPTPRPVRHRDRLEAGCLTGSLQLFILPHTVIGFVIIYQFAVAAYFYAAVSRSGVDLEARVTQKVETPGRKRTSYHFDYVFTKDGEEHSGQVYLEPEVYSTFEVGDPLPLRVFSLTEPAGRWHRIPGEHPGRNLASFGFACVAWNGMIWGMYWFMYVRPWRERRIVRDGRIAVGRVVAVTSWEEKGHTVYKVRYEFDSDFPSERTARGSKTVRHPLSAADVQVGDTLTVLFDARKPRRSLLYRFANFQVRTES